MRDENGFKCHTQSESHVRQILLIGEDPRKHISDYSNQFQRDFLQLLRTSHGEKAVNINHFYQEYIANKEHVHMNATKWPSLTEYAKFLGREGICRVEEGEKGLMVAWIDNSPEALRRQDAIRKKERQDKGDEEREQRLIREQIGRAKMNAEAKAEEGVGAGGDDAKVLQRTDGEKITLSFGVKAPAKQAPSPPRDVPDEPDGSSPKPKNDENPPTQVPGSSEKVSLKMTAGNKPKNVFALKKNALGASKVPPKEMQKKPMSEAERIMKEEIEEKRLREANGFSGLSAKRQRVA